MGRKKNPLQLKYAGILFVSFNSVPFVCAFAGSCRKFLPAGLLRLKKKTISIDTENSLCLSLICCSCNAPVKNRTRPLSFVASEVFPEQCTNTLRGILSIVHNSCAHLLLPLGRRTQLTKCVCVVRCVSVGLKMLQRLQLRLLLCHARIHTLITILPPPHPPTPRLN